jgi:hypothetical protein
MVPSIPDAQSLRCLFYPNGRNNEETLNLALIWPYDDPPTEFMAMKDPAEMTEWLQKRLPWLELMGADRHPWTAGDDPENGEDTCCMLDLY